MNRTYNSANATNHAWREKEVVVTGNAQPPKGGREERDGTDEKAPKLSAAGRWIITRFASARVRFRQWRQESWLAASIKTGGILLVVVNAVFGVHDKQEDAVRWLGWDKCHIFDPATGKPDKTLQERPCRSGEITFVKWTYPYKNDEDDVTDQPNRIFQVMNVNGGQVTWGEQTLRLEHGTLKWYTGQTHSFLALGGGVPVPSWQMLGIEPFEHQNEDTGFILRRIDIVSKECNDKTGQQLKPVQDPSFEFFVRNIKPASETFFQSALTNFLKLFKQDTSARIPGNDEQFIYIRATAPRGCGQTAGAEFQVGPPFGSTGYKVASMVRDL